MNRKIQIRLAQAFVVLLLTLGAAGIRPAEASPSCPYIGCEFCSCMESSCINGQAIPECGGNYACCSAAVSNCWRGCIWY